MDPPPRKPPHLIDVRSPAEYATGHHAHPSPAIPTVNIEYTSIQALEAVYAARGIQIAKHDDVWLYCRSGRRSAIAKQVLLDEGWANVTDLGGWEVARAWLEGEGKSAIGALGEGRGKRGMGGEKREKGFGALVEGLRALEE